MTSNLIAVTLALPEPAYVELDTALERFTDAVGNPADNWLAHSIFAARAALGAVRSAGSDGRDQLDDTERRIYDAALGDLARLDPITWSTLRGSLLDAENQNLDAGCTPIAAWLSRLVVEVDGRRLAHDVELARLADGRL